MYAAACSWRGQTSGSSARWSASKSPYVCTPGIPKTVSTPCRSSERTIASPPLIVAEATLSLSVLDDLLDRALAEQVRGVQQVRVVLQLARGAVVADAAAFEHVRGLREPERHVCELLDQQDARAALRDPLQRRH